MQKVDYETVEDAEDTEEGSDFPSMFWQLTSKINFKVAIFIFIIGFIIFSDVFVRNVLGRFDGSLDQINGTTTRGTIIQLMFLVVAYLMVDLLVQGKYV